VEFQSNGSSNNSGSIFGIQNMSGSIGSSASGGNTRRFSPIMKKMESLKAGRKKAVMRKVGKVKVKAETRLVQAEKVKLETDLSIIYW
jgi:CRISPR/Cas system-associated protein Cas7 (RAMP superfamily)